MFPPIVIAVISTRPNAPDFTSILKVEDEIYSITQFEWRNPGVAYLSELEQNATTVKLTVCCRVLILVLSCLLLPADDTGLRHRPTRCRT